MSLTNDMQRASMCVERDGDKKTTKAVGLKIEWNRMCFFSLSHKMNVVWFSHAQRHCMLMEMRVYLFNSHLNR